MSELSVNSARAPVAVPEVENKGVHYQRVMNSLPGAIKNAPPAHLMTIAQTPVSAPDWYLDGRAIDRVYLTQLMSDRVRVQGQLDKTLGALHTDIKAFATPLLTKKLQQVLGVDWDVNKARIRLDTKSPILFIDTGASLVRESTLLEAALHNFEASEVEADAFRRGSGIYIDDEENVPRLQAVTVGQFATLCRELDIGRQYQEHIKALLKPADPAAKSTLRHQSIVSERAAFAVAGMMGAMKKDLSTYAHSKVQAIRDGERNITFHDRPLLPHRLSLMGFRLTGIVLFSAVAEPSKLQEVLDALTPEHLEFWIKWSGEISLLPGNQLKRFKLIQAFFANGPSAVTAELVRQVDVERQVFVTGPLIAYIPDDPDHPLKEYDSLTSFMKELLTQLLSREYQQFFCRFVAQRDKGRFVARVNERLKTYRWHEPVPFQMGPWWRETAVENPSAEPITNLIEGDLFSTLFENRRLKAIADARCIAVPTGDEDAQTRWKRISSVLSIGWNVFNFAAMLVPGLGEVMLGVMVAQMLEELVEGIEDWSKGDRTEGSAHINSVLINFAQLGLMSAGHVLPTGALPVKPSALFDNLKEIKLANGKTRLWNQDLTPYNHDLKLPANAKVNDRGLHAHEGKIVLPLNDQHFVVDEDPLTGEHSLQHPRRPDAYQPKVRSNGAGAWHTELEKPLGWQRKTLLRRLGHEVAAFTDETLEQILTASGVSENALRRLHVEGEPLPALLKDEVQRFRACADAGELGAQIIANEVPEALSGFLPGFVTEMPRWPDGRAVELFDGPALSGRSQRYGNDLASSADTIKLTREELAAGKLPERVVDACSESEIHAMLGRDVTRDRSGRIEAFKDRMAMQAGKQHSRVFESVYEGRTRSGDPRVVYLQSEFKGLATRAAEDLVARATPEELEQLQARKRVPLRLREEARRALVHIRSSRAYEGLYLKALETADTARLALHTLEALPGWPADLCVEVREFSASGTLHDSVGPVDADARKVLVLREDGRYQAYDQQGLELHGADDFYNSVLRALPDSARKAMGYDIYEGARLKKAVADNPLPLDQWEPIVGKNPIRKPAYDPHAAQLRGGMFGFFGSALASDARESLRELYPSLSSEELDQMLSDAQEQGLSPAQKVAQCREEFGRFQDGMLDYLDPKDRYGYRRLTIEQIEERRRLYRVMRQCWSRSGPRYIHPTGEQAGYVLDLSSFRINQFRATDVAGIEALPPLRGNFDHVTVLRLNDMQLNQIDAQFLRSFPQVRILKMSANSLIRLPGALADMPHLTHLDLSGNAITFTPADVAQLREFRQLETLGLSDNPLQLLPDISQMKNLHTLTLARTGATTWPTGLFSHVRYRDFSLDLYGNRITRVPDVAPGSYRAELIARTLISREEPYISPDNLRIYDSYVESVGLEPERPYPPRGARDSLAWEEGLSRQQWIERLPTWDNVEEEFGSTQFFNIVRKLTESRDYNSQPAYRAELTSKVWRMLEAMEKDTALREKLFTMADSGVTCADAGAQLFNAMGVEVLVNEAYELANKGLVESALVELARGKCRLDEIGKIARARVSARLEAGERFLVRNAEGDWEGTIDEVEVHLAYMTDLAEKLDLPWQSRDMLFRSTSKVTPQMIEDALERVLALEEGDQMRDLIVKQPFWDAYIRGANRQVFKNFRRRVDAVSELWYALGERAESAATAPEQAALESRIQALAKELGIPASEVEPGKVMSGEDYAAHMDRIEEDTLKTLATLTQQAMDRAKLQRVEIPFTVQT